ncbi:MAG: hypothetical protein ABI882_18950, partial [Acidobacteriota bacterium]
QSNDGGQTFVKKVVSEDRWNVNGCPVAGPSFNIGKTGNVTAVWFVGGVARPGLYYATLTEGGAKFSIKQPLDSKQRMAKHAQTTALPDGNLFVAWDYVAERTFTAWGVLDPNRGLLWRSTDNAGITYPVVASNDRVAIVAGMRPATHEIAIFVDTLRK